MKLLFGIPLLFTLSGCIADPYYNDSYSYTETTRTQYIPSGSSMIYTETVVRPQIYYQPSPVYVYPRPVYRPYYPDRRPDYRPHYDRPGHNYGPNRPNRPNFNNGHGRPDNHGKPNGNKPGNGNDHGGRPDRP